MPFFLFMLRFITMLWMFLLPLGFWAGAHKGDTWGRRLLSGISWAWAAWLLVGAAWAALLLLAGQLADGLALPPGRSAFFGSGILLGSVWSVRQLLRILHQRRMQDESQALAWLKEISAADFEALVGRYFKSIGCVVRRVGKSGDHGVDLAVYTPHEGKWIVQCKRYKRASVGEGAVRDLYGAMMHEHADQGFLFTTSIFSEPARAWAQDKPIELVGGEELVSLLNENNVTYQAKSVLKVKPE